MKHIRNVPWEVGNIVPDFELGKTTCALFLRYIMCVETLHGCKSSSLRRNLQFLFLFCSVRYHSLHPNYVHDRLKSLGKQYQLRVLLVLVDTVSIGVYECVERFII